MFAIQTSRIPITERVIGRFPAIKKDARRDSRPTAGSRPVARSRHSERLRSKRLLGHHHLDELIVVHLAVAVDVSLADHLVNLLVGELLAEVESRDKLRGGDNPLLLVEHLERLLELFLGSVSFILRAIRLRNSGKSMVPLPSSTSLII